MTDTLIAGTDTTNAGGQQGADGGNPSSTGAQPNTDTSNAQGNQPGADGKPAGAQGDGNKPAEGDKPAGDKPAGDADGKKPEGDKIAIELGELPEGIQVDQGSLDKLTEIVNDASLDAKAKANAIGKLAVQREADRLAAHVKQVGDWAEAVKTDPELGGEKLQATLATAKKAIDLGPPELKDLLNSTGMGNHPAVVRWAYTVGKALSEDSFVQGGKAPGNTGTDEAAKAKRLYG